LPRWAGWGFDVFDALLFNFVAPNCVPVLLGLQLGKPEAHEANRLLTVHHRNPARRLAAGGVLFGWLADRIGRGAPVCDDCDVCRGTALCAAATNIWLLIAFRALASLGIGGSGGLVQLSLPRRCGEPARRSRRYLQSSSPWASSGKHVITCRRSVVRATPQTSWRYVSAGLPGDSRVADQSIRARERSLDAGMPGNIRLATRTVQC